MCIQTFKQRFVAGCCRRHPVHNDDIDAAQFVAVMPERFPDDPLQTVSSGAQAAVPFTDSKAQPGRVSAVRSIKNGEHIVATAFRFIEDATDGVLFGEPAVAPEALVRGSTACRLFIRDEWALFECVKASASHGPLRDDASVRDGRPW